MTDSFLEGVLDPCQVGRDPGTSTVAIGIHEVNHNMLTFDQVVIEPDRFVLVSTEHRVGVEARPQRRIYGARCFACKTGQKISPVHFLVNPFFRVKAAFYGTMSQRTIMKVSSWFMLW